MHDSYGQGLAKHAGQVQDLLEALQPVTDLNRVAVHMHDSYGQGLANTLASLEAG